MVLKLKIPWRNGTTHLVILPLEFMQRLAELVPRPRLHLIRFHGVLASNAKPRSAVVLVPAQTTGGHADDCAQCSGHLRIIAAIERILMRLGLSAQSPSGARARRVDLFQAA